MCDSSTKIMVTVFNYFIGMFPKEYIVEMESTLNDLKVQITQDTELRFKDIKGFKNKRR